jgi:glycosyltransferase involved in cell wall biosynthesis
LKTAIIIPTHKRAALLKRLLTDLARAAPSPDISVHVVENGARSGAEAICEDFARNGGLRYRYFSQGHKSGALNFAIRNSSEDFIIFFDDDVALPGDIVSIYVEAARRYGPGHFFGGPLIADAQRPCPADLAPYLPLSAVGWAPSDREMVMEKDRFRYFFGANWAVFRSDLDTVGDFSEELGITASPRSAMGEENDIQERLVQAGVNPVYLPGAMVRHHVPPECYTPAWVWRRRFRLGVTDWKRTECLEQAHCRKLLGVPAWLLRAALQQKGKAVLSAILRWPGKTDIRMREAYLRGLLHGAWTTRRRRYAGRVPAKT